MRWPSARFVYASAGGVLGAGLVSLFGGQRNATGSRTPARISADEFNAMQDSALLSEAFDASHRPWPNRPERKKGVSPSGRDFNMTLYRMKGCPYCERVEWLLRYHLVPFEIVEVGPLTTKGFPDQRFVQVPQIGLEAVADPNNPHAAEKSVAYVADSQHIIAAISVPLGFTKQLSDPRIMETRKWMMERFQAAGFLAINSTWRDAYTTYPHVTPSHYYYQNPIFHVVGATALYALAKYKVAPRFAAEESATSGFPSMENSLQRDPSAWLAAELSGFATRLSGGCHQLHGGKEPDIADVEMYGLTRIIDAHPRLRSALHEGPLKEWCAAMEAALQKRTHVTKK
ncbi:hypothetical protein, conserved [Trypanosoma brucei gambiense DAL972]|uniref:GST N-terminal domain-containing protein n=1 Tax=Trypanosoma brucei gambiense (strain MHOM/CI/86/DAL972) TaxID=679716 RepID=C9ZRQ5_TRYB9|nr:hypothetical protein, conserved [Trypanosoma brucei gambiense DAL972]CBH12041.1 hypothetical protein, conserved [Trypanosoma brucei gambiense DAL972]|eukprot:XP_011774324.1 hypothetical protein, conserved [Trypanosoma brucei gambiense DAL972]